MMPGFTRRRFVMTAAVSALAATSAAAQTDGLPSWNDGPVKQAILDFVRRVTSDGSADSFRSLSASRFSTMTVLYGPSSRSISSSLLPSIG
jgi:hypothetical protein